MAGPFPVWPGDDDPQTVDLFLGSRPRGLEALLLLTDGRELITEFLLSLRGGGVLATGLCRLDLRLDLVL